MDFPNFYRCHRKKGEAGSPSGTQRGAPVLTNHASKVVDQEVAAKDFTAVTREFRRNHGLQGVRATHPGRNETLGVISPGTFSLPLSVI